MKNRYTFIPKEHIVRAPAIEIRPARPADVDGIAALVHAQARQGNLLPRPAAAIYETIDDWIVAVAGEEIVGCVSLLGYPSGLVEVRSLAVQDGAQGRGIGRRLLAALIDEARRRKIPTLFALTRAVGFFLGFGFVVAERESFPEKVWRDCWQCPLLDACDETAVVLTMGNGDRGSGISKD